jgi:hypothetical protein
MEGFTPLIYVEINALFGLLLFYLLYKYDNAICASNFFLVHFMPELSLEAGERSCINSKVLDISS